MKGMRNRAREEAGATLIHIAIGMVAIMAFSALVIDYGIFWVARRQAQNAADAGALAAAMALAFDDPDDFTTTGPAQRNAQATAESNLIWGQQPILLLGNEGTSPADVSFPNCPDDGAEDVCVRVDVYRAGGTYGGANRTNPLPTFFAQLVGIDTQNVMATATARVLAGTESDCMRPWAVADKWEENVRETCTGNNCNYEANDTWSLDETYDKWKKVGNSWVLNDDITSAGFQRDEYRAAGTNGPNDPGTGFGLYNPDGSIKDYGQLLQMKLGGGNQQVSPGWFLALDMSGLCTNDDCPEGGGASMYGFAIRECVGGTAGIGDTIPVETGNMATGPTGHNTYENVGNGPPAIWERDPNARWNPTTKQIENSCAPGVCADGNYYSKSPRIVPVPLFNLDSYLSSGFTGSNGYVTISNVFGFLILSPDEAEDLGMDLGQGNPLDTVYGVMVTAPGTGGTTTPSVSTFLQTIVLVR